MGYQQVGDKKIIIYGTVSVLFPHQLIMNAKECRFYLVEGLVQSAKGGGNINLYVRLQVTIATSLMLYTMLMVKLAKSSAH